MTTVLIVIAAVIVVAIVVLAVFTMQRRRHLKEQFGPEYDRLVDSTGGRRAAESELRERERRHESLDVRPLDPATRDRYVVAWVRVAGAVRRRPAFRGLRCRPAPHGRDDRPWLPGRRR